MASVSTHYRSADVMRGRGIFLLAALKVEREKELDKHEVMQSQAETGPCDSRSTGRA
jgi:hypothetical protein